MGQSGSTALVISKVRKSASLLPNLTIGNDSLDFYELFELERFAEMDEKGLSKMRKAFLRLAKKWHPDKNDPSMKEKCNQMMNRIVCAKQTLEEPGSKTMYDVRLLIPFMAF